jgi:hypothetical protein
MRLKALRHQFESQFYKATFQRKLRRFLSEEERNQAEFDDNSQRRLRRLLIADGRYEPDPEDFDKFVHLLEKGSVST